MLLRKLKKYFMTSLAIQFFKVNFWQIHPQILTFQDSAIDIMAAFGFPLYFAFYFFLNTLIFSTNGFVNMPLEDIFVITKNNQSAVEFMDNHLASQILRDPEAFQYNSLTVTDLNELKEIDFNLGGNCVLFYYVLKDFDDFHLTFDVISAVEKRHKMVGMFKSVIRLHVEGFDEIQMDRFERVLQNKMLAMHFFQDNPLLVQIRTRKGDYCFTGYRIDNLVSAFVVKEIFKNPNEYSCFSHTVEGLIDAKISQDFGGANLIVQAVNNSVSDYDVTFGWTNTGEPAFKSGFGVEVLLGMKSILNFSVITSVSDAWGSKIAGNSTTWDGSVGDMVSGKIDLVISATSNTGERTKIVDFNFATHTFSVKAFFRDFCSYRSKTFPLLSPFHLNLWVVLALWVGVNLTAYKYLRRTLCRKTQAGVKDDVFQDGLGSWGFTTICQQGLPDTPVHYTLRIIYYLQLLVALVLYAAFSGTLVAFVSVSRSPIRNLDDLINDKYGLQFGIDPIVKGYANASSSKNDTTGREILRRSVAMGDRDNPFPVVRILSEKLVFVSDDATGFRALANTKLRHPYSNCFVNHIFLFKNTQFQGTYVKKKSRMRRALGLSILRMMETGNVNRLKKRFFPTPPHCEEDQSWFVPAELPDLNFAFLVIGFGVIISFVFGLYEFYSYKRKE